MDERAPEAKAFQKAVKAAQTATGGDMRVDGITCKRDGTVEAKRSYFYRFGKTASDFAASVQAQLEAAGIEAVVIGEDRWAAWPKTSYFVAVIRPRR